MNSLLTNNGDSGFCEENVVPKHQTRADGKGEVHQPQADKTKDSEKNGVSFDRVCSSLWSLAVWISRQKVRYLQQFSHILCKDRQGKDLI